MVVKVLLVNMAIELVRVNIDMVVNVLAVNMAIELVRVNIDMVVNVLAVNMERKANKKISYSEYVN